MPLPVPFLPGAIPVTPGSGRIPLQQPGVPPRSGGIDWGAFLRRRLSEVTLAPLGPLAAPVLDQIMPPDTDPATGLPINPAVTDARAVGELMDRLGMGAGWRESTKFLDTDPNRNPIEQLGDRMGLLGALINTSGREIALPGAGAASAAAGFARASGLGPLASTLPGIGPLMGLLAVADPQSHLRALPLPGAGADGGDEATRARLRDYWAEGGAEEQIPGSRFAVEMLADPTNLIFTRTLANALGKAGASLAGGPLRNAAGASLEEMAQVLTRTLDAQDDLFKAVFGTGKEAVQAIPWINEFSKSGRLSEFTTTVGDVVGQLRRSRIFGGGADTDPLVALDLPEPHLPLDEIVMPSIIRVPGQMSREELTAQLASQVAKENANQRSAWATLRDSMPDPKAWAEANPKPDDLDQIGMIDLRLGNLSRETAAKLRALTGPETLPAAADIASHGAAQLDEMNLRLEQWEMYLAGQVKNNAMTADDAAAELLRQRTDHLSAVSDIHAAMDAGINRAAAFKYNQANQSWSAQMAAEFHQKLADAADYIDDLPRTLAQTRAEIMESMLARPRADNVWRYHPIVEAIQSGNAPVPLNRLYTAATAGAQGALDEAALKFTLLTAPSKAKVIAFAKANGYDRALASGQDFKDFIAEIQASRIPDETFLGQQAEQVQDMLEKARLDVFAERQQAGQDVLDELSAQGAPAEKVRNYLLTRFQGDLAERLLGREGVGRYEAFLTPERSEWFRNQGNARDFDQYLSQLVRDRARLYAAITRGSDTANLGKTNDEIMTILRDPREAVRFAEQYMSAGDVNDIRGIYEKWRRNPFPKLDDEADAVWDLVTDRLRRDKATQLGIKDNPTLRAISSLFGADQVLQEEALAQPGTLLTNLGGGTLLAALNGSDPVNILRNAVTNARKIFPAMSGRLSPDARRKALSELDYVPSGLRKEIYDAIGMEVPASLTQQTKGAIAVQTGRARDIGSGRIPGLGEPEVMTAIERVPIPLRAAWGGVEGAGIGSPGGPLGMLAGAVLGALYRTRADPEIKVVTSAFYNAVEGALRGTRVAEAWQEAIPYLEFRLGEILKEHIGGAKMPMMGERVSEAQQAIARGMSFREFLDLADQQPLKPPGNPMDAIREATRNGPLISADEVRRIAFQNGMSAQEAARAGQDWARVLQEVSDGAIDYANKTNFDYLKTSNLEEFLRGFVWFPTWPVKFAPLFAEMLSEHPEYLWSIVKFNDMSERVNKQADRPAGMAGYLGGGLLGTLLSNTMWGRAGYLGLNVTRAVAGQVEALADLDEGIGATPVEKALSVAKNFGLGLRPQLQIPLEILGVANESPFEVMRSNPMKAAIVHALLEGVNAFTPEWAGDIPTNVGTAEAPLFEARHLLRRALSPVTGATVTEPSVTGSETKDQMIRRRIVELAYEQNGQRPQGPYAQALNNPSASPAASQVWDYARRDVEHVIATQTILNNTLPARARYISKTEQALRGKANRAREESDAVRSELTQRKAAGQISPKEAADIERREGELIRRANPLADVMYNVTGGKIDTEQRARAEVLTFQNSIAHLPAITQRIMIRKFYAQRPDLARAMERYQPGAAQRYYMDVEQRSGR